MIAHNLEVSLHLAFMEARHKRHEFITVEHILLSLLDNPDAVPILTACGANIEELRSALTKYIDEHTPVAVDAAPHEIDTQPTLGFQRVIQRAILHVQSKGVEEVTGADCLLALFGETDSFTVTLLEKQKIGRLDVIHYLEKGTQKKASRANRETQLFAGITLSNGVRSGRAKAGKHSKHPQPAKENLRLFISYSHVDTPCLDRLLVHLRPLERDHLIDCWSDRKIRSGDNWRNTLQTNLDSAAVAVLMVSADFLASEFIVKNELPPLLLKAEVKGLRIIPVVLSPCGFHRDQSLRNFQSLNDPSTPLLGMDRIDQEFLYDKIAGEIYDEFQLRKLDQ